ncbi:MAG TPA: bacteriohopanetetrol glucosamine biosynthesis glycosyltransferase HpnI [Alphaproteobacteria bacterium]|nr:bacteriohopanetetrol glucosamine biosynthesis glycosyltransferase HpnI [Alphaproteobacteria bacterium]
MLIVCLAGIAYCAIALVAIVRFARRPIPRAGARPGVTILKPIHGLEAELFENLCSFCEQDYETFEVMFGVARADDPAIGVIRRVIARFPNRDLSLVVDDAPFVGNPKIANLQHLFARAKYDLLVIADADMRVDPRYLSAISATLSGEGVGAVTCLYAGDPRGGLASQLAALQLNDQFAPSVLVATFAGDPRFCLGSTMAVRRSALEAIGGLAAIAPFLADDYMLGALLTARGYRVVLSRYVVRNIVAEPGLRALVSHELRWARTIRSVQTAGYVFSFVTFPLPFALAWAAFSPGALQWGTLLVVLALRVSVHEAMRRAFALDRSPVWMIPLRDCLGLGIWAAGLFGTSVRWKDQRLDARELL